MKIFFMGAFLISMIISILIMIFDKSISISLFSIILTTYYGLGTLIFKDR